MTRRALLSLCALAALCLAALPAAANDMDDRWFYAVSRDGSNIHLTLQLIEEDPPSFDTTWSLTRDGATLFEHRRFARAEADEIVGPGCIPSEAGYEADCDGDSIPECDGWCGTAYRYEYVDACVPEPADEHARLNYALIDDATQEEHPYPFDPNDDLDAPAWDDACRDASGCAVAAIPGRASEAALAGFMLLVGLGFAVASRRR